MQAARDGRIIDHICHEGRIEVQSVQGRLSQSHHPRYATMGVDGDALERVVLRAKETHHERRDVNDEVQPHAQPDVERDLCVEALLLGDAGPCGGEVDAVHAVGRVADLKNNCQRRCLGHSNLQAQVVLKKADWVRKIGG